MLHTGGLGERRELVDRLAGFVALRGARGVVVFDGAGDETSHGPLEVRFEAHADRLIERLAVENRDRERVCVVTSDTAVLGTAGQEVRRVSSKAFLRDLAAEPVPRPESGPPGSRLEDGLDAETREQLERWRRQKD
ncbi:MAG: hypothetical protein E6G67_06890 [Actinobacteria bacterium]|nr:MAG: hypothetical protein E6G67_06890 [Actinomycetota bacterium]